VDSTEVGGSILFRYIVIDWFVIVLKSEKLAMVYDEPDPVHTAPLIPVTVHEDMPAVKVQPESIVKIIEPPASIPCGRVT